MTNNTELPSKVQAINNNAGMRDLLGGGLRLIIIGFALFFGIRYGYNEVIEFAYPYFPPSLVTGIQIWSLIGFVIPGIIFLLLCIKGKALGTPDTLKLSVYVRVILTIGAIMACIGFLGIRTGIMILLNLYKPTTGEELQDSTSITPTDAIQTYRLYLIAGGVSTLIWGLFFFAITEMIEVLPIDSVTQVNQIMIAILTLWVIFCMILPGVLFISLGFWIHIDQLEKVRQNQLRLIRIGGPLACIGVFGFSIGVKALTNRWMIQLSAPSTPK